MRDFWHAPFVDDAGNSICEHACSRGNRLGRINNLGTAGCAGGLRGTAYAPRIVHRGVHEEALDTSFMGYRMRADLTRRLPV